MDPITRHHYENLASNSALRSNEGSISTVRTQIVNINGQETLIPTIWDGKELSTEEATRRAIDSGIEWDTGTIQDLEQKDFALHQNMREIDPGQAKQILQASTEGAFESAGGTLTETDETFEGGYPMWKYKEDVQEDFPDEEYSSLMSPSSSARPKGRTDEVIRNNISSEWKDSIGKLWSEDNPKGYASGGLTAADKSAAEIDALIAKYENDDSVSKDPYTWQEVTNAAMDFTPILGDAKGIVETGEDLSSEWQKNDPDYTYMGIVGGAGALAAGAGLVPFIGDYASKAIKGAARKYGRGLAAKPDDALETFVDDLDVAGAATDATREGIYAAGDSVSATLDDSIRTAGTDVVTQYEQNVYEDDLEDRAETTKSEPEGERTAGLYNLGGLSLADSTKGITHPEGRKMANKKFQLDPKNTDANGDGTSSEYEKLQAEAKQIASVDTDDADPTKAIGMATGGIMKAEDNKDPVSGNVIPLGSTAENVRDDIPAMLSQDEYVIPAHVVKWHGLKTIQQMQEEAECGLMCMEMNGRIGGEELDDPEEDTSDDIEGDIEEDVDDSKNEDKNDGKAKKTKKAKSAPSVKKKKNIAFMKMA